MEVASVSTSLDFDVSASAGAALPESEGTIYSLSAGVGYTERSTVTYTPLQGAKFVTQLMSPVDLDTILLLYHSDRSRIRGLFWLNATSRFQTTGILVLILSRTASERLTLLIGTRLTYSNSKLPGTRLYLYS